MPKINETKAKIKKQAANLERKVVEKIQLSPFELSLKNEEMEDNLQDELEAAMAIEDEEKKAEMIRLIKLIDERKRNY